VLKQKRELERELQSFDQLAGRLSDCEVLLELATEAADPDTLREAHEKIGELRRELEQVELRRLLSGEHDDKPAIVSINAGAGGTEACDWASMLMRMYLRWAERNDYKVEMLDLQDGEEAGIKSATFTVAGDHPFGYLRTEVGIHRLVRISPFDSQSRRHTSFASFTMVPDIEEDVSIEIDEKDLRIDTFRAGGAGGQHVNRTDSAVRITHLPSGIVVQCQNERSQHKNKAFAMKVLKARLFEKAELAQKAEVERLAGEKKEIGFGSQIRSYTLHPSQRVKDHRTGFEAGNADGVLDGDIDGFIRARLLQAAGE
jgi:peptide chain release factor 2